MLATNIKKPKESPQIVYKTVEDKNKFPSILVIASSTYFTPFEKTFKSNRPEAIAEKKNNNNKHKSDQHIILEPKFGKKCGKTCGSVTCRAGSHDKEAPIKGFKVNVTNQINLNVNRPAVENKPSDGMQGQGLSADALIAVHDHQELSNSQFSADRSQREFGIKGSNRKGGSKTNLDSQDRHLRMNVLSEGDAKFDASDKKAERAFIELANEQLPSAQRDGASDECNICYDNPADTVIMNCGHGGLCCDCAKKHWEKSTECFICRGEISQILQIERIKNNKSLAKVITAYQRVVKQTPTEKVPVSRYYIEEVNSLSDENENE